MNSRIASLFTAALVSAIYAAILFAVWYVSQIPDLRLILIVAAVVGMVAGLMAIIAVMGASVFSQDNDRD